MAAPRARPQPEGGAARRRVSSVLRAVDARDAARFCEHLAEDAVFVFGNAAPLKGLPAIRGAVHGFFQGVRALRHVVADAWALDRAIVCRGTVTYTRHDGTTLTVPFANICEMRGPVAAHYQIYVDVSRLS